MKAPLHVRALSPAEQGLTVNQVSSETIRQALKRLGMGWQQAKHWITSPDPDPKAPACYGMFVTGNSSTLLRFVDGRPVSAVTMAFLQ